MLRDFVIAVQILPIVRTRPREILLAMITMRKSTNAFLSYMNMGLCWVAPAFVFKKMAARFPEISYCKIEKFADKAVTKCTVKLLRRG